jgi:hypothetical protein
METPPRPVRMVNVPAAPGRRRRRNTFNNFFNSNDEFSSRARPAPALRPPPFIEPLPFNINPPGPLNVAPNFNNGNITNTIDIPANSSNAIMNNIMNGNTLYRVSNVPNTVDPGHYMRIRAASGEVTEGRKHLRQTRKNPLTREAINFADKRRMKKAKVGGLRRKSMRSRRASRIRKSD